MSSEAKNKADTNDHGEVSVTSDGLVRKTVLTEGEGDPAGRGAKVTIKYTLRRANAEEGEDDVIDSSDRRPNGTLTFTQGRKKVLPALDVIVPTMRQGEVSKASVASAYAFGARGLPRKKVPPNSSILLDVEMIEFSGGEVKKAINEMTPRERFEEAKVCKEAGNVFFKEAKYEKAMVQYSQCIRYVANVFYKPKAAVDDKKNGDDASAEETVAEGSSNSSEKTDEKDEGFTEATVTEEEEVIETLDVSTATRSDSVEEVGSEKSTEGIHANGVEQEVDAKSEDKTENNVKVVNGHDADNADTTEQKDVDDGGDDPTVEEARALHVTALNNLSLCLVKMEQFKQAVETATMALELDPQSSKAFYHRYVITFRVFSRRNCSIIVQAHPREKDLTFQFSSAIGLPNLSIEDARRSPMENGTKQWKISRQQSGCSLKTWAFVWRLQSWRRSAKTSRILRKSKQRQCLLNWSQDHYAGGKEVKESKNCLRDGLRVTGSDAFESKLRMTAFQY